MRLKMLSAKYETFWLDLNMLTPWGRVVHIWVGKLTTIGPDNALHYNVQR